MSEPEQQLDPITFEVLKNAFVSVCNEMSVAVEMSAYSTVISEGRDYSATIYDAAGNLVAQGQEDLPSHAGTATFTVKAVMAHCGPATMRPGDVYIMNDPYMGGTHLQDVRAVQPIFHDGEIVAYVAATGHWADVGGMYPGSFFLEASEIYQEGLQLPPVLAFRDGELNKAVIDIVMWNMRVAHERRGDLNAQIAACRAGDRRLGELIERYGLDLVLNAMTEAQDYSERLFRAEIARVPDGTFEWEDWIDQDPKTGVPQRVHVRMTIAGDQLTYDVTGSGPPVPTAINATYPALCSGIVTTTKALFPQVMLNSGLLRAMEIVVPEESIVNASRPYPTGGVGGTSVEKVIGCILGVWSQADPPRPTAGHYNLINITYGGRDPRTGEEYVGYVWTEGGIGARATKDGLSGVMTTFSASTRNISVEIQERRAPLRWDAYQFRPDSCGAGEHQGGHGSMRELRSEVDGMALSALGDRERFRPWGLYGGSEAASQHLIRHLPDGTEKSLGVMFSNEVLDADDQVSYLSTGGGGYGPPQARRVGKILDDVRNEFISLGFAAEHYGVVIEARDVEALDYRVDLGASRTLRRVAFGADAADVPGAEDLLPSALVAAAESDT
jgi:N-methylhydantoinase B